MAGMALQCNIDSRGKAARLAGGLVLTIAAVIAILSWAWPARAVVPWVICLAALAGGIFMIFEARTGWCVLRAMGFKTPV